MISTKIPADRSDQVISVSLFFLFHAKLERTRAARSQDPEFIDYIFASLVKPDPNFLNSQRLRMCFEENPAASCPGFRSCARDRKAIQIL